MRVLIACEHSGMVREAFRANGHDAWSCDILPASDGSKYHIQCDVLEWLDQPIKLLRHSCQLVIAHPPCTYLTNSAAWAYPDPDFARYPGVGYHQRVKPGTLTGADRRAARAEAIEFFRTIWNCGIEKIAIENPVGCMGPIIGKAQQIIQPYEFGSDASKGTCLWLRGLPPLRHTSRIPGRRVEWPKGSGGFVERWANQTESGQNALSPSDDRGHVRSITYPGIATAMAEQWGGLQAE